MQSVDACTYGEKIPNGTLVSKLASYHFKLAAELFWISTTKFAKEYSRFTVQC